MIPAKVPTRLSAPALRIMLFVPAACVCLALLAGVRGVISPFAATGFGLLAAGVFVVLWRGWAGKYFALALCLTVWVALLGAAFSLFGDWLGFAFGALSALALTVFAFNAALPWPAARAERLRAVGRATIEWEWVYVPRDFVKSHRYYRFGLGIYLTAAAIIAAAFFSILLDPWGNVAAWPLVLWVALTFLFMALKGAIASPMVYIALLPGLPFTIPFLFYWADGVRPNLIYRHRFERLCHEETPDV